MFDVLPRVINLLKVVTPDYLITQTFGGRLQEVLGKQIRGITLIEPSPISHYQCQQLLIPSFVGFTGHPTPRSCDLILEGFDNYLKEEKIQDAYGSYLYISRQYAGVRHVLREDDLIAQVTTLGFSPICLENLNWQQQIAVFRQAKVIIAPHGAALANLVFCQEHTTVIEIFNPQYLHWCYWQLCSVKKLNYYPYFETDNLDQLAHDMTRGRQDIEINLNKFIAFLEEVLKHV